MATWGYVRPEKRKVDSSILSLTTTDQHGQQPAIPAFRLIKGRFLLNFSMSAGVCRGVPPCPWDVCGGGPGGGLVGFLWGTPRAPAAHVAGRKRPGTPASGEIRSQALVAGQGLAARDPVLA
jgi:hypothetical protein